MSTYKPTVLVLGGAGTLGPHVINALTSDTFINKYNLPIRIVSRTPEKVKKQVPAAADEAVVKFVSADLVNDTAFTKVFDGVDVVINLLGLGPVNHNKIADAAAASKVKLYIPSHFGTEIEHTGPYKPIFALKTNYLNHIKALGLKYASIITGPIAEILLSVPFMGGVNFPEPGKLQYYGNFDLKISTSCLTDLGKTVASVAAKDPTTVPSQIRVSSGEVSPRILIQLYKQVTGKELEPVDQPLESVTSPALKVAQEGVHSPSDFLVGLKGALYDGKLYVPPNENEFVSKDLFKFTSIEEIAKNVFHK